MSGHIDRKYQEAVALWQAFTDAPPPEGDACAVIDAALKLAVVEDYDRFNSRWLNDPNLTWAVCRNAPPDLA